MKPDKTIKIIIIAPSPLWEEVFTHALNSYLRDGLLKDTEYRYELAVVYREEYFDFSDLDFNALEVDVIIARGSAFKRLRKILDIPIVQVPFTMETLRSNLAVAKQRFQPKRVCGIGYNFSALGMSKPTIVDGIEVCIQNIDEDPAVSDSASNKKRRIAVLIDRFHEKGYDTFIVGQYGHQYAESQGYHAVFNEITVQDAWHSIENAIHTAHVYHKQKVQTDLYQSIMNHSFEGILFFDSDTRLQFYNDSSKNLLLGQTAPSAGPVQAITLMLERLGIMRLMDSRMVYIDHMIMGLGKAFVVNIVPIADRGEHYGCAVLLQDAARIQTLGNQARRQLLQRGLIAKYDFDSISGTSEVIQQTKKLANKYAQSHLNIMIVGESGTGKEVFAQSIHNASPRRHGPFVAINCAALSESLLESELFGYTGGAFTGAVKGGKAGYFEMAHEGTIFLDEISEISPKVQGKLLRAIQEHEIVRLGDDKITNVDVRVISATNRDLRKLVDAGAFREDLYYRIDVLHIDLPNLSKRTEDIPLLAKSFFDEFITHNHMWITVEPDAYQMLQHVYWKGNIRQLRNVCMRASIMAENGIVNEAVVRGVLQRDTEVLEEPSGVGEPQARDSSLQQAIAANGGNKTLAAKQLGISRATLYRKLKKAAEEAQKTDEISF